MNNDIGTKYVKIAELDNEKKWINTAVEMAKILQATNAPGMSTESNRWGHLLIHLESDGHYADLDTYPKRIKEMIMDALGLVKTEG